MENYSPIKFVVGEEYKNEKGLFEVLAVKGERMRIRWENGEEHTCDVRVQRRIQERRRWENLRRVEQAAARSRAVVAPRAAKPFESLHPEDFKDKISRSPWRGRQQLGGAVSRLLYPRRPRLNSWAARHGNQVYWADARHWKERRADCGVKFVARANSAAFAWGLSLTRERSGTGPGADWQALMKWLARDDNDARLRQSALEDGLRVFDAGQPVLNGLLAPAESGWMLGVGKTQRSYKSLREALGHLPAGAGKHLMLAAQIPSHDALARGQAIVQDIARVFEGLMPLYEAAADRTA